MVADPVPDAAEVIVSQEVAVEAVQLQAAPVVSETKPVWAAEVTVTEVGKSV